MVTTGLRWFFLQRNGGINKAFATQLTQTVQGLSLTWGAPQRALSSRQQPPLWGSSQVNHVLWKGMVHSQISLWHQAEVGVGTWTSKLGSALRSISLEVTPLCVRQGHSANAHGKALCIPEQPDRTSETPPSRTPGPANNVEITINTNYLAGGMKGYSSTTHWSYSTDLEFPFQGTNRRANAHCKWMPAPPMAI